MEKIYKYGSFSQGYLISNGKSVIAVDGGKLKDRNEFAEACKAAGISPEAIQLIIVTHGHEDHYDNVAEMKALTGAPVLCHKNAADAMIRGLKPKVIPRNEVGLIAAEAGKRIDKMMKEMENGEGQGKMQMPPMLPPRPVTPDIVIDGDCSLEEYGFAGKILYTPGHSDSDLSVILDSGAAFTGDMIVTEPDSGLSTIAMYTYKEGTDRECQESVKRILAYADICYAGHGGPFTRTEVQAMLDKEKEAGFFRYRGYAAVPECISQ